jgi:hypothetical protein
MSYFSGVKELLKTPTKVSRPEIALQQTIQYDRKKA